MAVISATQSAPGRGVGKSLVLAFGMFLATQEGEAP